MHMKEKNKVVLIMGANRGLGLKIGEALSQNNTVIKYIRNIKKDGIKKSDLKCCKSCEYQTQSDRCPGMAFMEEQGYFTQIQ